jgi:hypothetical protein
MSCSRDSVCGRDKQKKRKKKKKACLLLVTLALLFVLCLDKITRMNEITPKKYIQGIQVFLTFFVF